MSVVSNLSLKNQATGTPRTPSDPASQLPEIREPLHNLREIAKQLLMLEDHLACDDRRCHECCRKHMLAAEGLCDEAIILDEEGQFTKHLLQIARFMRQLEINHFDMHVDPSTSKVAVRKIRKFITDRYGPAWTAMYAKTS